MTDRETLEVLKAWIMSCGTEEAGKYEPPSAKDAVGAVLRGEGVSDGSG